MLDPSGVTKSKIEYEMCPRCNGYGLEKKIAIKCDCPSTFCWKCENREGFKVRPWEECELCYGRGEIIKKIKSN